MARPVGPEAFAVLPDSEGVPRAYRIPGELLPLSVSITHTRGYAAAAAVPLPLRVGIDVERILEQPQLVARDHLASSEVSLLNGLEQGEVARRTTVVWVVKEAVMKTLGEGLRIPTTSVVVRALDRKHGEHGWCRVEVDAERWRGDHRFDCWVEERDEVMIAVAVRIPPGAEVPTRPVWIEVTQ